MSRAIENYICASEDRPHYNNETWGLYGFYYPMRSPQVTIIQNLYTNGITEEKVNELIDARVSDISDAIEFYPIPDETVEDIIEKEGQD